MTTTRTDQAAFLRHRWETPMTTTPPPEGTTEPRDLAEDMLAALCLPISDAAIEEMLSSARFLRRLGWDRPSPPVPAAEDDAVREVAKVLARRWNMSPRNKDVIEDARAALDAAGVGDLAAEVERLRELAQVNFDLYHEAMTELRGLREDAELRAALAGSGEQAGEDSYTLAVRAFDEMAPRPAPVVPDTTAGGAS